MEKIKFAAEDGSFEADFFVLEQTMINEENYLLVTDIEEKEAFVLKEQSTDEQEVVYEMVEDDKELDLVVPIFEELLEDISIER